MRLLWILAALSCSVHSVGQVEGATIQGVLRDSTGAVIPRARIELRSESSASRALLSATDGDGSYRLEGLKPGDYTLEISCPGFESLKVKSIAVSDGQQLIIPGLELAVGRNGCNLDPLLDFVRFLPPGTRVGNLGGSVRIDLGGMISDPPRVAEADVMLLCGRTVCGATRTDAKGEFMFTSLKPGHFAIRVVRQGFYPSQEEPVDIQEGRESVYYPLYIERCPGGDCNPRLRPRRPLVVCE